MSTFRVNLPFEVTVGTEVDSEEFQRRFIQLLYSSWQGGPSRCPETENFLVSARHLLREVAAWALAAKSELLDLEEARGVILSSGLSISCVMPGDDEDD